MQPAGQLSKAERELKAQFSGLWRTWSIKYESLDLRAASKSAKVSNFSCLHLWGGGGGGVLPYSLGGEVPLSSRKSYPLQEYILWPYTRVPI